MKALLLMNPASRGGRGKKTWPKLFAALDKNSVAYETRVLRNIGEAAGLAAGARGFDAVAAVGGDGTVNAVAAGVLAHADPAPAFAVLYTGTSPDFCTFHGIPTAPEGAAAVLAKGHVRETPVLLANGEPFFCSCNPGMGAEVAARANALRPRFGDRLGTFLSLLGALLRDRKRDFVLNGSRTIANCNHLLVTRMPYIAGGLRIALPPLAENEYGLWHLENVSRAGWLARIPALYRGMAGTAETVSGTLAITCPGDPGCPYEFDGDPRGVLPLEIAFSPRKLKLIVPEEPR